MYTERYPALSPPPSGKQIYAHAWRQKRGFKPPPNSPWLGHWHWHRHKQPQVAMHRQLPLFSMKTSWADT